MILCQNNKIVSHARMIHVKLVQITAPAKPALVIKIKIIHAFCLTAFALLNFTLIFHNRLTVNVSYCIYKDN
jgi:hypothetical protein